MLYSVHDMVTVFMNLEQLCLPAQDWFSQNSRVDGGDGL